MPENEWLKGQLSPEQRATESMESPGIVETATTAAECLRFDPDSHAVYGNGHPIMDEFHAESVGRVISDTALERELENPKIHERGNESEHPITDEFHVESVGRVISDNELKRKLETPKMCECGNESESAIVVFSPNLPSAADSGKRGRGRPRGSVGKSRLVDCGGGIGKCTVGKNFMTYVETVQTGEDVVGKILSFSQKGSQALCVLSATGPVSSVVISQPACPGGTLQYEGRFEILSLSGSCTHAETCGARRKISRLSVSLAKSDGRVFGGAVAGSLIAAAPIQLVIGIFKQTKMQGLQKNMESSAASIVSEKENCMSPKSEEPILGKSNDATLYWSQTLASPPPTP